MKPTKSLIHTYTLLIICFILTTITSCNNDDEPDNSYMTTIVAEWNDASKSDTFVFLDDGTGYEYSATNNRKEYFSWIIDGTQLILNYDSGRVDQYKIKTLSKGKLILINTDGQTITLTNDTSQPTQPDDNNKNHDPQMIGEWWEGSVTSSYLHKYICNPDGTGYRISSKSGKDHGIKYTPTSWRTVDNKIFCISFNGDTEQEYDYSIDGKNITLKSRNSSVQKSWKKMSENYNTSFDATQPPFANYLKYLGYYYEISKFTSGQNHAGVGDNMNEKFLHFFGSDGKLTTTGLRIVYYTPYWDGIDSYWGTGTYIMSQPSGAYRYTSTAWCNGSSIYTYDGARLKITSNGSITTYNYTDSDIELCVHVKRN